MPICPKTGKRYERWGKHAYAALANNTEWWTEVGLEPFTEAEAVAAVDKERLRRHVESLRAQVETAKFELCEDIDLVRIRPVRNYNTARYFLRVLLVNFPIVATSRSELLRWPPKLDVEETDEQLAEVRH